MTNELNAERTPVDGSAALACYLDSLHLTEPQEQAIRNVFAREEAGWLRSDLWDTPTQEDAEYEFVAGLWRAETGDQVSTDQGAAMAWLDRHYDEFCSR
jgi:hypothetical protein